jgi:hypothetical protein
VQKLTNTSVTIKARVRIKEETRTATVSGGGTGPATGPEAGTEFEARPEMRAPVEPQAADIASVVKNDPVVRALVENLGGKVVGIRRRKDGPQGERTA